MDGEIWFGVAVFAAFALLALMFALDVGGVARRTVAKNQETVAAGKPTYGTYAKTEREAKRRGWLVFAICVMGLIAVLIVGGTQ